MRRLAAVLVLAAATLLANASTGFASLPTVLTQHAKRPFVVRPASIDYTGDRTGILGGADGTSGRHPGHLRWTTYSARSASGTGVVWLADCRPGCTDNGYSAHAVRVRAYAPRHGHFTRLTLRFRYAGKPNVVQRRVQHKPATAGISGYYFYVSAG